MFNKSISVLFSVAVLVILFTSCTLNKQSNKDMNTIPLDGSVQYTTQQIPENSSIIALGIFLLTLIKIKK